MPMLGTISNCSNQSDDSQFAGGGDWIRTSVGVSQQIYSLPPLATRAPLQRAEEYSTFLTVDSLAALVNAPKPLQIKPLATNPAAGFAIQANSELERSGDSP